MFKSLFGASQSDSDSDSDDSITKDNDQLPSTVLDNELNNNNICESDTGDGHIKHVSLNGRITIVMKQEKQRGKLRCKLLLNILYTYVPC